LAFWVGLKLKNYQKGHQLLCALAVVMLGFTMLALPTAPSFNSSTAHVQLGVLHHGSAQVEFTFDSQTLN
jgi:hypothetical protein